eukprot:1148-Chlamydomonas_euryale.AAC.1
MHMRASMRRWARPTLLHFLPSPGLPHAAAHATLKHPAARAPACMANTPGSPALLRQTQQQRPIPPRSLTCSTPPHHPGVPPPVLRPRGGAAGPAAPDSTTASHTATFPALLSPHTQHHPTTPPTCAANARSSSGPCTTCDGSPPPSGDSPTYGPHATFPARYATMLRAHTHSAALTTAPPGSQLTHCPPKRTGDKTCPTAHSNCGKELSV